jgi:YegS/Rv2252/BmrU family lipid kinase
MNKRILVIFNPAAGRNGKSYLDEVVCELKVRGADVTTQVSRHAGDLEQMVAAASSSGWDCISIAGGDGSLMEAVNGASLDTPLLALISTGTANVVSRELGLPSDAAKLAEVILAGHTRELRLAEANDRLFVFTAGVGFDAWVVASVSGALKKRFGKMAFAFAALRAMQNYRFPVLDIVVDGKPCKGVGVIVMSGSLYAGRYLAAPGRRLGMPDFSVIILRKSGMRNALSYLYALGRGRLSAHQGVDFIASASSLHVTGEAGIPFQADGDNAGVLPLTVRANAGCARLIVPATSATAQVVRM